MASHAESHGKICQGIYILKNFPCTSFYTCFVSNEQQQLEPASWQNANLPQTNKNALSFSYKQNGPSLIYFSSQKLELTSIPSLQPVKFALNQSQSLCPIKKIGKNFIPTYTYKQVSLYIYRLYVIDIICILYYYLDI